MILEELERAKARGAKIYAEVVGFGAACDPAGIEVTTPNVGSMDLAIKAALRNAGIDGENVDAIVAHGTAVPGEDRLEVAAWRTALGDRANRAPATTSGGLYGALFAGGSAVSLALAAMVVHQQTVPPTPNFAQADIGCEMNFAATPRPGRLDCVACGAFATGGQSAAMVLRKYETA